MVISHKDNLYLNRCRKCGYEAEEIIEEETEEETEEDEENQTSNLLSEFGLDNSSPFYCLKSTKIDEVVIKAFKEIIVDGL